MSTSPKVLTALSIAAVAAASVLAGFTQHERNAPMSVRLHLRMLLHPFSRS